MNIREVQLDLFGDVWARWAAWQLVLETVRGETLATTRRAGGRADA